MVNRKKQAVNIEMSCLATTGFVDFSVGIHEQEWNDNFVWCIEDNIVGIFNEGDNFELCVSLCIETQKQPARGFLEGITA